MTGKRDFVRENIEAIYQEHLNGKHLTTIAKELGMSGGTISAVFNDFGLEIFRHLVPQKKAIDDDVAQEMYKLYLQGYSTIKVGEKYGKTCQQVHRAFKRMGFKLRSNSVNSRRYTVNHHYFDAIDTQEKAYWLGFLYADGYVSSTKGRQKRVNLSIGRKDEIHLYKLLRHLNANYPVNQYKVSGGYKVGSPYSRISIASERMYNALVKHGCVEHKTNVLKAPKLLPELERHFIRGYLDGDGSIYTTTRSWDGLKDWHVSFAGTNDLLRWIYDYLVKEDLVSNPYKFKKRKPTHTVGYIGYGGNRLARSILNNLYKDSTIHLDRKYYRYLKF